MADSLSLSTTYTGRVASVNDKGLRLDGHDAWYNVSKFAPPFELPERGQTVTVCIDSKGFLRSCVVVGTPNGAHAPQNGAPGHSAPIPPSTRETTITRLAVLKAAAEFAASKQESKSADVLKIAACWERWVLRSDDDTITYSGESAA